MVCFLLFFCEIVNGWANDRCLCTVKRKDAWEIKGKDCAAHIVPAEDSSSEGQMEGVEGCFKPSIYSSKEQKPKWKKHCRGEGEVKPAPRKIPRKMQRKAPRKIPRKSPRKVPHKPSRAPPRARVCAPPRAPRRGPPLAPSRAPPQEATRGRVTPSLRLSFEGDMWLTGKEYHEHVATQLQEDIVTDDRDLLLMPPLADGQWQCARCTLVNEGLLHMCYECGTERVNDNGQQHGFVCGEQPGSTVPLEPGVAGECDSVNEKLQLTGESEEKKKKTTTTKGGGGIFGCCHSLWHLLPSVHFQCCCECEKRETNDL